MLSSYISKIVIFKVTYISYNIYFIIIYYQNQLCFGNFQGNFFEERVADGCDPYNNYTKFSCLSYYLNILTLFNTVNKLTPVSAIIASHIGAMPNNA